MIRIEQQNNILKRSNEKLKTELSQTIHLYSISHVNDWNGLLTILHASEDSLFREIAAAKKAGLPTQTPKLYYRYARLKEIIRQVNAYSNIISRHHFETDINGFTKLDNKSFIENYCNSTDSLQLQNQLLLLESDALMNYDQIMNSIISYHAGCNLQFHQSMLFAVSDRYFYKKGDTMKINASIVHYATDFEGQAIIEDKIILPKNGRFEYSRIITESKGRYRIPVRIIRKKEADQPDTLFATATLSVE